MHEITPLYHHPFAPSREGKLLHRDLYMRNHERNYSTFQLSLRKLINRNFYELLSRLLSKQLSLMHLMRTANLFHACI
jgi:hypothetical protein